MIFTILLVPSLSAPNSINLAASSNEEIPPAAFIFTSFPTYFFIKAMSLNVAPPVENPVEVLIYSAPDLVTISYILRFSSSVKRQVSIITFNILPLQAL